MVNFHYETDFQITNEAKYIAWIEKIISSERKHIGELNYIFCDDAYLFKLNVDYLDHDTLTDIISFDYSDHITIQGDIFISIDRVKENAKEYKVSLENELRRVMSHGILHYCGYKDKTEEDTKIMRQKEEEKIALFN